MTFKMNASTLALGAILLGVAFTASAHADDMMIVKPWARASAGMAHAGAAFMTIKNMSATDDEVIAAKSDIAKKTELHTHKMENGIMKMRQVPNIPVPAHGEAELKPGGYHIMFMGLKAPLKEGQHFALTLEFKNAGEKKITVDVLSPKSMGDMGGMGNMKMGDMDHSKDMEHSKMDGMKQKMDDASKKMNGMK